jgi:hypothetical protein
MTTSGADLDAARTRSVDNLQRLYTVVVSLAVTESLRRLLTAALDRRPENHPQYDSWLMFSALLITVIPFYHGANRYLDATYVTHERRAKPEALMLDFVMLFFEGLVLFVLATMVGRAPAFYTSLGVLLVFDVLWVGLTLLTAASKEDRFPLYRRWAIINLVSACVLVGSFWSNIFNWNIWRTDDARNIAVFVIVLLRTAVDYILVWRFYYPTGEAQGFGIMAAPAPAPPPKSVEAQGRGADGSQAPAA